MTARRYLTLLPFPIALLGLLAGLQLAIAAEAYRQQGVRRQTVFESTTPLTKAGRLSPFF